MMAELSESQHAAVAGLDQEALDLALQFASVLADSRRMARRTLRRALEDVDDGMPTMVHISVDPERGKRGERVNIYSTTGTQLPVISVNVPGMNLRSAS